MAFIDLLLALYTSFVPKDVSRRSPNVQRVAGWAFVLSGIA
jgi:hypothetical protein